MINPLQFFSANFSKMPPWVRVSTWFILLFLTVYLYLAPRFINGHVVVPTGDGGFIDHSSAIIRMSSQGRVLKYKTNNEGYVSIPVISRLPSGMRLEVYHEDKRQWYSVDLSRDEVWKNNFDMNSLRFVLSETSPFVALDIVASHDGFGERLYAGLHELLEAMIPAAMAAPLTPAQRQAKLVEVVSQVMAIPADSVTDDFILNGPGAPSMVKRLSLYRQINATIAPSLSDEEWRSFTTLGQLKAYLDNQ